MPWWQTQFDKLLVATLALTMCALALTAEKTLAAFAMHVADGLVGCLLTLVTARRPVPPEPSTPKPPA